MRPDGNIQAPDLRVSDDKKFEMPVEVAMTVVYSPGPVNPYVQDLIEDIFKIVTGKNK